MSERDVVIVGGGPAGLAAALHLARAGARVSVVDEPRPGPIVGDHLPGEARVLLDRLHLGGLVEATGAVPSRGIASAWGSEVVEPKPGVFSPWGAGWHLDRARFQAALLEAGRTAGVQAIRPVRVTGVQRTDAGWIVDVRGLAQPLRAKWLLDATGRSAWLGRALGRPPIVIDELHGLVRVADGPVRPFALVEACPDGWFYSAPLPSDRAVVMFFTDAAPGLTHAWPSWWPNTHTATRLAGLELGPIRSHRATSQWSTATTAIGWLPVGDAALARDPLSSKGLLGALTTGLDAGDAIIGAHRGDPDASGRYLASLRHEVDAYLRRRARVYGAETRHANRPFWRRRGGCGYQAVSRAG